VMNHPPSGLKKASLPLWSIARAEKESRERICFNASLPWQRSSWALRSVSTVALSSTRAHRFYHYGLPDADKFVKVRSSWVIVKELHPTFHSRKSGLFISRFCGLFIPLLTTKPSEAEKIALRLLQPVIGQLAEGKYCEFAARSYHRNST